MPSVCQMAPKRTRGAGGSRQVVVSSDSSSDNEEVMNRFTSVEARAEYKALLKRGIIKDRLFLVAIGDGELVQMVNTRGWVNFCQLAMDAPVNIVREFYANAKENRDGITYVRGYTVDYTPQTISRVLSLPPRPAGVEDWTFRHRASVDLNAIVAGLCVPGTEWTRSPSTNEYVHFPTVAMNRYARAWNLFVCANLLPSTHQHEVTVERAILLWAIINGHYIDIGYMINQIILHFLGGSTTGSMPFPSVITYLCRDVGVRWATEEPIQAPTKPIDSNTIARLTDWAGGVAHPRGLGYVVAADAGGHAPGFEDVPVASQYRRMMRRIDAIYDSQARYAQDLNQTLSTAFVASGVHVDWPVFGAHSVYPPPDSPPQEGGLGGI